MRTKHESTATKGVKYTINKNKLTFMPVFFQPRSTFAVQQHGRTVLQRMLGDFTHLARYPRELLSR